MEAVVIDAGSKLLKAGFAIPDQAPSMVMLCFTTFYCSFKFKLRTGCSVRAVIKARCLLEKSLYLNDSGWFLNKSSLRHGWLVGLF